MYFYFKTVKKGKEIKVVPLDGQSFSDGTPIVPSLYVSCPKALRSAYPLGDIFYSFHLTKAPKYYSVSGSFHHLDPGTVAEDEYRAFRDLRGHTEPEPVAFDEAGEETVLEGETTKERVESEEKKAVEVEEPVVDTMKSKIDRDLSAPTPAKDLFYVEPDNWTLLVRNIKNHTNTMIIGPTGTGKTSVVKMLCDKLGLKLHVFDMGSMVDPISSLLGVHRLEKGESTFDYAKFTQVIQEPCVILLDELSRAAFSTMNILFPCLDDRRKLSIEIACGKGVREIPIHPEVTFIATANVGAEYTGTNSMDRALTNRFFPIELGDIPAKEEIGVLVHRSSIKNKEASSIVKIANNLRSLYRKQELSSNISIRETLLVSDLVRDGWDIRRAMELVYLPLFEGTSDSGERGTVNKTIISY